VVQQVERRDHERVGDPPLRDERGYGVERDELNVDLLSPVEGLWAVPNRVASADRVTAIALDRRVGGNTSDIVEARRRVSRFLTHLAGRCGDRIRVLGIDHAPGNLECHLIGARPVLTHADDVIVGGQRNDVDPVGGIDHEKVVIVSRSRGFHPLSKHVEHPIMAFMETILMGPGIHRA